MTPIIVLFIVCAAAFYIVEGDREPRRPHRDCMIKTAEMELEIYGQVISSSVRAWYEDRGVGVPCLAPHVPPNPGMNVKRYCTSKCKDTTEIRADGRVLYRLCEVHGYVVVDKPPPPPGPGSPSKHEPGRGICAHCEVTDGVRSH